MDRQQMIDEIKNNIGSYIQHGGAIEGGGWKVYYPISLSRVLSTLGLDISNGHIETHQYKDGSFQIFTDFSDEHMCVWKLLNEDNSDCMLDDQSDETIKAIREIICKCDHVGDGVAYMTNPAQYKCKKCGEMFK